MAVPAGLTIWSVVATTRRDLYSEIPQSDAQAQAVDWRTLDALASQPGDPQKARPDMFGPSVRVTGYVIAAPGGEARRFFLVPNAGNLFHAPHMDAGEAIEVTLPPGVPTPRANRQAVAICGLLSADLLAKRRREPIYHLAATDVRDLPQ